MSEEILVNVTPIETRVAVVENGILQEIYIERASRLGLLGNIYKGRVVRVLPGMQAAFVEIGLERTGFLHETDLVENAANPQTISSLTEGQEIIVQVVKNPVNNKGARLTTQLSVSSRSLVLVPNANNISVSLKIIDPVERERLKQLLSSGISFAPHGFIIRTSAEGAEDLEKDKQFLMKLWDKIKIKSASAACGDLIYQDLRLAERTLRDIVTVNTERVRIDNMQEYEKVQNLARDFASDFHGKIELYQEQLPIFDNYNINEEIHRALQRNVSLKSGGYLVIDQNEAMITIDVNTGGYVGSRNLEETVYKTNLEAASVIARQVRLRNLAGIIIIDFIDMYDESHREKVLKIFEKELAHDSVKTIISDFSALSLVQMTRKRVRESLLHSMCEPCPSCTGRGYINTAETICIEILREIQRFVKSFAAESLLIIASPAVVDRILEDAAADLANLEQQLQRQIKLQADPLYQQEQYDVILL